MFGGKKQSFCFLNWQRAKVLLKLEFDTEDQVLYHFFGTPGMKVKLYQDYEKLIRIKDVRLETEVSLRTAARQESIQV